MAFGPSSPVTGASVTGLTSPTYTLTADTYPGNAVGEQYAITTLGGTQTGVEASSVSLPFTLTMVRPSQLRQLGVANPSTGFVSSVPMNVYKVITRKGVQVNSDQKNTCIIETVIKVPAGADSEDPESIRAAFSCHVGALWGDSDGIADVPIYGTL